MAYILDDTVLEEDDDPKEKLEKLFDVDTVLKEDDEEEEEEE